ncbi:hypothetical protein [Niallia taxi]|uniref:hypothetical protein n=1 Tax=Niallia taxi TaxID=2499688 RepID=UPI0015F6CE40|nr:hypothetical protein [Niallia taxi]
MPNTKVIITKDCVELNGQVAEIVSDYITSNWEQKYIIQTNDKSRITLHEGEFEPLLKLVI